MEITAGASGPISETKWVQVLPLAEGVVFPPLPPISVFPSLTVSSQTATNIGSAIPTPSRHLTCVNIGFDLHPSVEIEMSD